MSSIDELRAELANRRPESTGTKTMVLGIAGAFLAGGLLVFGWQLIPFGNSVAGIAKVNAPSQPEIAIAASSNRLGQASAAPILLQCMTRVAGGSGLSSSRDSTSFRRAVRESRGSRSSFPDVDMDAINAGVMYAMLQAGKTMAMASSLSGQGVQANTILASKWGELAECVFNQDATVLCDRNNRALAIESLTNFVRNAGPVIKEAGSASADRHVTQLRALNERVMASFRDHLRHGALIRADFGMFAPETVKQAASTTTPTRNVCAPARG